MTEVTITVSGDVGTGKSALLGEIEIMCKALSIPVRYADEKRAQADKNMNHADWTTELEMYKPRVVLVEAMPWLTPPPLPAATAAASVPSCPEIQKAFMTLESNGEARTIVLKFNQSADAYAVHDFLLKGASAIGLMYPGDAASVRASTLEEAATELEAMQKSAADDIAYWGNSMDGNDLAAQSALTCGASAIRALISKETTHGN